MIEDVKLAVEMKLPIHFYGRCGGNVPSAQELFEQMIKLEER
jgi:hypothetical protein